MKENIDKDNIHAANNENRWIQSRQINSNCFNLGANYQIDSTGRGLKKDVKLNM